MRPHGVHYGTTMSVVPLVVSIVGPSGVGKTTLIEGVITQLAGHGVRVATVKHAAHGFQADRPGSDSARHQAAGAAATLLVGGAAAALFLRVDAEDGTELADAHHSSTRDRVALAAVSRLIAGHLTGFELVLVEGFAPIHDLLIEVHRSVVPAKQTCGPAPWLVVSDVPGPGELHLDDVSEITARLLGLLDRG